MRKKADIGVRFGRLLVVAMAPPATDPKSRSKFRRWKCECSCGKTGIYRQNDLHTKKTRSCGCLKKEIEGKATVKHGMRWSPTYRSWLSMRSRCLIPSCAQYKNYGGRGIKIDKKWDSFSVFLDDMGPKPKGMSLDRINNNGPYSPRNCRWATKKQQARNTRRNRFFVVNGERQSLAELCEKSGAKYMTVWRRLKKGHSIEDAIQPA